MSSGCGCNSGAKLIFACSGAADVGALADQVARKLTREGKGKMFCLAGVGGRIPGIIQTTDSAERILAIDGCPLNCTRGLLLQAGYQSFQHLQLADLGVKKGATELNEATIAAACSAADELLNG